MKSDDLVFVNQQLASYLSSGIPLEAALRDAAGSLKPGQFRKNLTRLTDRLESGQPFDKSIQALDFPDIYKKIYNARHEYFGIQSLIYHNGNMPSYFRK